MSEQPAAGWYADPTSRFEHRYWDGATWTEHVSRNGQATTDPLDGGAAVAGTVQDTTAGQWEGSAADTWQPAASPRTNSKAIVSLVLAIVWVFGLASVAAIVLGVAARREIRERPDEGGAGVATAGIVIGAVGVAGGLLMFAAVLTLVGGGMSMAP